MRLLFSLFFITALVFILALAIGSIPFQETTKAIIIDLRLPRVVTAFSVGGLLSLAGALLQVQLRNPLADPYIMGVSGGASVFYLSAMALGASDYWLHSSAFVGSLFSMGLVLWLMKRHAIFSSTRLTLMGVLLASAWAAMISFILSISHSSKIYGLLFWLMGDLSNVFGPWPWIDLFILMLSFMACQFMAGTLNVMGSGDSQARALGVSLNRTHIQLFLMSSLMTATAVSSAGNIGFVGLMIPHVIRWMGVSDYKKLLSASVLLGGSFLMMADLLSRVLWAPLVLPVGIMTALMGIPVCVYLCLRGSMSS